jgi:hypothetical protein
MIPGKHRKTLERIGKEFLSRTLVAQEIAARIDKWNCIKILKICALIKKVRWSQLCGLITGCCIPLHWPTCLFLCRYYAVFVIMVPYYYLKSDIVILPALLFLFTIPLAILWSSKLPYKFCDWYLCSREEWHWNCYGDWIESVYCS